MNAIIVIFAVCLAQTSWGIPHNDTPLQKPPGFDDCVKNYGVQKAVTPGVRTGLTADEDAASVACYLEQIGALSKSGVLHESLSQTLFGFDNAGQLSTSYSICKKVATDEPSNIELVKCIRGNSAEKKN